MQEIRGGKQNHEGGWSNYKEGRWVFSLQNKSHGGIKNPLQVVHVTDVVNGISSEVYSSLAI